MPDEISQVPTENEPQEPQQSPYVPVQLPRELTEKIDVLAKANLRSRQAQAAYLLYTHPAIAGNQQS